ncbi:MULTISPECIES: hypothetical protein [unclassified Imperialibacter]|uniref:hypothetical protein n=1 Tax=unclassified Imperialibacter TaxID=2629706 RepID=UPI00125F28C7|nr:MULTISPECIES: hypothetical protein [unclassified Imperialibacter]CAD5258618.1 hypothetical protein IMPERIA89_250007 [Imperialibacter sp. 89]
MLRDVKRGREEFEDRSRETGGDWEASVRQGGLLRWGRQPPEGLEERRKKEDGGPELSTASCRTETYRNP